MTMPLRRTGSARATDRGRVRAVNEDAVLDRGAMGLWAVADGMGGHQSGDLASRTICRHLAALPEDVPSTAFEAAVLDALEAAHMELRAVAARRGPHALIGATVLVLLIREGHFAAFWAGDSRLYRLREGKLTRITRDHSHVQEMVDAGRISAEAALRHPNRNLLTRAIGTDMPLRLDKATDAITPGDVFLLCTDGLYQEVSDLAIAAVLNATSLDAAPEALVRAALDAGGSDNVSAIVVQA